MVDAMRVRKLFLERIRSDSREKAFTPVSIRRRKSSFRFRFFFPSFINVFLLLKICVVVRGNLCFIRYFCERRSITPSFPSFHLPKAGLYASSEPPVPYDDKSSPSPSTTTSLELFQHQLQNQQRQIDALAQLLEKQQHQSTKPCPEPTVSVIEQTERRANSTVSAPLLFQPLPVRHSTPQSSVAAAAMDDDSAVKKPWKVMLFIDGTWLYYSIHERPAHDCPLIQTYGLCWQLRNDIDWTALRTVICEQLTTGSNNNNASHGGRPMELVRASVYTSYKADTSPASYRYKLFQELRAAHYEVHMMETVGKSEKCVDIQLAVELMHYATTAKEEDSFDVAVLLTGDKDFMPAMIRTRQKGKRVALVSMRRGCNRALIDTPGLRDFDVVWLEDSLDKLVVRKKDEAVTVLSSPIISAFSLHKVIHDFIRNARVPRVASRDLGRYLKFRRIGDNTLLDELKQYFGGLHQFLTVSGCYVLEHDTFKEDKSDHSFWIGLARNASDKLLREAARTSMTTAEKQFFERYSVAPLLKDRRKAYFRTLLQMEDLDRSVSMSDDDGCDEGGNDDGEEGELLSDIGDILLPEPLTRDYSKSTVQELKDTCREFGLPVTGLKSVLLERVEQSVDEQITQLKKEEANRNHRRPPDKNMYHIPMVEESVSKYLNGLVVEYLHAKGGMASSRDVGRYLAANKSSVQTSSALKELKSAYGSLNTFVNSFPNRFCIQQNDGSNSDNAFEFRIVLQQ